MDEVNPSAVVLLEHPGYDYLFAAVDGCLSYDLSLMDTWGSPRPESVRILEVNLQRFYFPEGAYPIDKPATWRDQPAVCGKHLLLTCL